MRSTQEPPDLGAQPFLPQPVFCPTCASSLVFRGTLMRSVAGDADDRRWNQYECHTCGRFEFRFGDRDAQPQQPG